MIGLFGQRIFRRDDRDSLVGRRPVRSRCSVHGIATRQLLRLRVAHSSHAAGCKGCERPLPH